MPVNLQTFVMISHLVRCFIKPEIAVWLHSKHNLSAHLWAFITRDFSLHRGLSNWFSFGLHYVYAVEAPLVGFKSRLLLMLISTSILCTFSNSITYGLKCIFDLIIFMMCICVIEEGVDQEKFSNQPSDQKYNATC